jgi:hypothetical protein
LAIFETGSGFIPEKAWIVVFSFMIPTVAGVTGVLHPGFRWGSQTLCFLRLVLNHEPPSLPLLSS